MINPMHFIGLLIILLCLVMEGIISSDLKYKFIFWRLKHPLPGSRAFSLIARKDHRIDMEKVARLFHSGIPKDPREQNTTWYTFYKKHSGKVIVFQAHKAFLLTRDLATLTMIFIPASIVAHLLWGTLADKMWIHVGILFVILIAAIIASQNYGKRFVANVIVEELHSESWWRHPERNLGDNGLKERWLSTTCRSPGGILGSCLEQWIAGVGF